MRLRILSVAVAALVPFAAPGPALSHDAYDWINKGNYRNTSGEHCCGKFDCYEVSPERVQQDSQGYSLPDHQLSVPGHQAIPSEDGRYWVCKAGTRLRCFFAPLNGS